MLQFTERAEWFRQTSPAANAGRPTVPEPEAGDGQNDVVSRASRGIGETFGAIRSLLAPAVGAGNADPWLDDTQPDPVHRCIGTGDYRL